MASTEGREGGWEGGREKKGEKEIGKLERGKERQCEGK